MSRLPDPQGSYAVLIGSSRFEHLDPLPSVVNNISGIAGALTDSRFGGLPRSRCLCVVDAPTVRHAFDTLREASTLAVDTLVVYFAGHGRIGERNELYLCVPESNPDALWCTAIPYEQVRRVLLGSRARRRVVILDCCFSGRAIADMGEVLDQTAIAGSYILTATGANEVALAPEGAPYTAFTQGFIQVIHDGVDEGPEFLTFQHLFPRLDAWLVARGLPRPRQQGSDSILDLALVRNRRATRTAGGVDFPDRATGFARVGAPPERPPVGVAFPPHPVSPGLRPRSVPVPADTGRIDSGPSLTGDQLRDAPPSVPRESRGLWRAVMLTAVLTMGVSTFIPYLLLASRSRSLRLARIGLVYFAWTVFFSILSVATDPGTGETSPTWVGVVGSVGWVSACLHSGFERWRWKQGATHEGGLGVRQALHVMLSGESSRRLP